MKYKSRLRQQSTQIHWVHSLCQSAGHHTWKLNKAQFYCPVPWINMQHSYLKYTLEHSLSHSFEDVLVSCALTWPIFKADFYSEIISAVNSIPASIDTALLHLWYRWQKAEGCQEIRRPLLSLPNNQGNQKTPLFLWADLDTSTFPWKCGSTEPHL